MGKGENAGYQPGFDTCLFFPAGPGEDLLIQMFTGPSPKQQVLLIFVGVLRGSVVRRLILGFELL